jgi:hypothetical protein
MEPQRPGAVLWGALCEIGGGGFSLDGAGLARFRFANAAGVDSRCPSSSEGHVSCLQNEYHFPICFVVARDARALAATPAGWLCRRIEY